MMRKAIALTLPVLLFASSPLAQASTTDILKSEKKRTDCMASVVRKIPHADQPQFEIAEVDGSYIPIFKYRFREVQLVETIQFKGVLATDKSQWFYQTAFGGVSCAAKDAGFVSASKLTEKWKSDCSVQAFIFCA